MTNTFGINIIPDNDKQRLAALERYKILGSPPEGSFDNVARLASQIFKVPISLISLVDEDEVFFKANIGMGDAKVTSRGVSLCSLAVLKPEVTVFEDAPKEPCLLTNPNVAGEFGLKFYAGAPLTTHDGFRIGTLCVLDKTPRKFSKEDELVLEGLAKVVMDEIELRFSSISEAEKLQAANQELLSINEEIAAINEELKATNEDLILSRTKLKESEENLQTLADNISQLAWMADDKGVCYWYNKRWFEYTGTTPEDMMSNGWQKVHHPDHIERVLKKFYTDIALKGETWEDTFPLRGADGKYKWFLSRAVPFKDDEGRIIRWLGTNTDITEQRNLLSQKDDFLTIASHELKTPITTLRASLQLIDRIKNNPSSKILPRFVNQANRSMERIGTLVDDLLNVSKMAEGQLHLTKTTFVISEMIDNCCQHIHLDGSCELVMEGDKALMVNADEHRIEQVVVNLVNNALKYAPDSPQIVIKAEQLNDRVKISVKDTGNGIEPDKIPHLFTRYYRADYKGSQYSGLGLGLYISSEIVKRHDGEIGVESVLGEGSDFWFTLPLTSMTDLISKI